MSDNDFSLEGFDLDSEDFSGEEESGDAFTGFNGDLDNDYNGEYSEDDNANDGEELTLDFDFGDVLDDGSEEDDYLDLSDEDLTLSFDDTDDIFDTDNNDDNSADSENSEDSVDISAEGTELEESAQDSDSPLDNYQENFVDAPQKVTKKRKIPGTTSTSRAKEIIENLEQAQLTPRDYRLIMTQETVNGVDLANELGVHKDVKGAHTNRVTKRRYYDRGKHGVLSPVQMQYFTHLSRTNLSNARYPDEYINLLRSNEELLDAQELIHKKITEKAITEGYDKDARERIAHTAMKKVTRKHREILKLVAQLKYASTQQIARAIQRDFFSTRRVLNQLKQLRFVRTPDSPYYDQQLWCVTDLGMVLSDIDINIPDMTGISVAMLQHTTVVNNVAAFIYSGSVNVLDEHPFPPQRRIDNSGAVVSGENFVSESQIRSSLGKLTSSQALSGVKGNVYIPVITADMEKKFSRWKSKNDPTLVSPEREYGNEYMWVLFPPPRLGIVQHIPDLVIPRDRGEDGKPESVAIEVELKAKSLNDYVRTLKAYAHDKRIFKKVVWICSKRHTAHLISKAAEEEKTLLHNGRIDILPIETENGVFKGNNVLALG